MLSANLKQSTKGSQRYLDAREDDFDEEELKRLDSQRQNMDLEDNVVAIQDFVVSGGAYQLNLSQDPLVQREQFNFTDDDEEEDEDAESRLRIHRYTNDYSKNDEQHVIDKKPQQF